MYRRCRLGAYSCSGMSGRTAAPSTTTATGRCWQKEVKETEAASQCAADTNVMSTYCGHE